MPDQAITGNVTVVVNGRQTEGPVFTVEQNAPVITAISPDTGQRGTEVKITGENFSPVANENTVKFNGVTAAVKAATTTELIVDVPATATTGPVTVTVNGMTATGPDFTVLLPPSITSLLPESGQPGTEVKITGENFSPVANENTVKFNGVTAAVKAATATELIVDVPATATTGTVTVTVNGMTATGPLFTVINPPVITSINPSSGGFDTQVTITGDYFSDVISENTVTFNGMTATVVSASKTTIVAVVPRGAGTGAVEVTVNGLMATGPVFTYIKTVVVNTYAGSGTQGFSDGKALQAQLNTPTRLDLHPNGSLIFTDLQNHAVRYVIFADSELNVYTMSGSGQPGYVNGDIAVAQFNSPNGVAVDQNGNIFIADYGNHVIRKISPQLTVTTVAGSGQPGFADGAGQQAAFNGPIDVEVDNNGNVYVADYNNHAIRKIDAQGVVTTIAGNGQPGFQDGPGQNGAQFRGPAGLGFKKDFTVLYIADAVNHAIRALDINGNVTTVAGNGTAGDVDGNIGSARFSVPYDVDTDNTGNIYVVDLGNNKIRIIKANNTVETFAGTGTQGFLDGKGDVAMFNSPAGVSVETADKLYVGDANNNRIRIITLE